MLLAANKENTVTATPTDIALCQMNPGNDGPSWNCSRMMPSSTLAHSFLNLSSPGLLPDGPQIADASPGIHVMSELKEE